MTLKTGISVNRVQLTEGITTEHLVQIYSDPFLARVAHDHRPHYPVFSPEAVYLSAWINDVFAGAFLAIRASHVELDVHVLLLRNAVKNSRELGKHFLRWCFAKPNVLRLTGYIPDWIPTARNHCLKMGFIYEGTRRSALVLNGQPRGMWVLGMTRDDWEAKWAE